MSPSSSRIQSAQERVRSSRYAIAAAAGVAFLGLGAVVRAAHPGHASKAATASSQAAIPSASGAFSQAGTSASFFGGGGSTVSPSQSSSAPAVQSSGS